MQRYVFKRLRLLYYIFISLVCLGISFVFFSSDLRLSFKESYLSGDMNSMLQKNKRVFMISSNIKYERKPMDFKIPIAVAADSSWIIKGRVNTFDVYIETDKREGTINFAFLTSFVLAMLSNLGLLLLFVLLGILFFSLKKSIKKGRVFGKKDILLMRALAITFISMSLCINLSIYIEHIEIASYLKETEWKPVFDFPLSFFQIIVGILIFFLSEFFSIGYKLQEDQELTI